MDATPPKTDPKNPNSTALTVDSLALLDRLEELLQSELKPSVHTRQTNSATKLLWPLLDEIRGSIRDRDVRLEDIKARSEALARAQADAIIHSAEIIDELEQTKQHLSDTRAAAEKAAQDTQRLADTVFERTHDAVMVLADAACIACNDNTLKLLECERSDLIGTWPRAFATAVHEDGRDASAELRNLIESFKERECHATELKLTTWSGTKFFAEVSVSAFCMKNSEHILVVIRDITSRKKFEAELRRHRDFLENVINAVPDPLSVKTPKQKIVLANDAFCRTHGINRDSLSQRIAKDLYGPVDFEKIQRVENELVETGAYRSSEREYLLPNGEKAILSVKHSLYVDESTGDKFIVETSRDITEDRTREQRLRVLANVFQGASEGVALLSIDGRIQDANPAFLSMSAVGEETPIGNLLTDSLRFEEQDLQVLLQLVANGDSWSGKAVGTSHTSDRSYWVSLSSSAECEQKSESIIALVSDITELESTQAKLRRQAMYDNLTGLPNRRFFREHLSRLVRESHRNQQKLAVCFLDLDDFKHVNDSAGHSMGDLLLQAVGKRIQRVLGTDPFVARFGGDEFAIIFPKLDDDIGILQEKLNRLLVAFRDPFHLTDSEAIVGLSIGVTCFPEHAADVDVLMCNADIAMYAAKTAGKNQVRFFTPHMQDQVNTRHQVQTKLRRALLENELSLRFQPKIIAADGKPAGCEALVRWQTADGSYIPPSDFIPVAEQTGLILTLGENVFQLAANQAFEWNQQGITPSIAVNISPHQLRHPRFVEQLLSSLSKSEAKAEWFELEITEHAMMDDVDHAIRVINELASHGFRIAIDDFGTGYSSLSYLKSFSIHTLKIDLSFVRDVTNDRASRAIVQSIVSLGKGLDLAVVAEGVETKEQADLLASFGCSVLQGYYIGKPMPADEYLQWLDKEHSQR